MFLTHYRQKFQEKSWPRVTLLNKMPPPHKKTRGRKAEKKKDDKWDDTEDHQAFEASWDPVKGNMDIQLNGVKSGKKRWMTVKTGTLLQFVDKQGDALFEKWLAQQNAPEIIKLVTGDKEYEGRSMNFAALPPCEGCCPSFELMDE